MNANRVTELNNQSINLTDAELSIVDKFSVTLPINELPEIVIVSDSGNPKRSGASRELDQPTIIPFQSRGSEPSDDRSSDLRDEEACSDSGNDAVAENQLEPPLNFSDLPVDEIDFQMTGSENAKTGDDAASFDDLNDDSMETTANAPTDGQSSSLLGAEKESAATNSVDVEPDAAVFQIDRHNQLGNRFERIAKTIESGLDGRPVNLLLFTSPEESAHQNVAIHNIVSVLANRNPTLRLISVQATTSELEEEQFSLGIGHVLAQENELDEVVLPTTIDNLDYLAFSDSHAISGATTGLGSTFKSRATRIVDELKKHYDIIAINAPVAQHVETAVWTGLADASYLLLNLQQTDEETATIATSQLRKNGARLVGCIITEAE